MKKIRTKRSRVFISYFGSYLLVLGIPVLITAIAFMLASNRIISNIERYTTVSLNQMLEQIDVKTSEIQDVSYRLANDTMTQSIAKLDKSNPVDLAYNMTQYVQQLLPAWITKNGTLSRMYVYFDRSAIVVSPFTFYDTEDFYNTFFTYGQMNGPEFFELLMDRRNNISYQPPATVLLEDMNTSHGQCSAVLFIHQIIARGSYKQVGAVFSLIDSQWIESSLSSLLPPTGGYAAIIDSAGRIIAETGTSSDFTSSEIEGFLEGIGTDTSGKNIVVRITSKQNYWKYIVAGHKSVLTSEISTIARLSIVFLVFVVLLGAVISFWQARIRTLPIARLTDFFEKDLEAAQDKDSFHLIETGIGRIMDNNRILSEKMERNKPLLVAFFLQRLFSGDLSEEGQIIEMAKETSLVISSRNHVVVIARIKTGMPVINHDEIERAGQCKKMLHTALEEAYGKPVIKIDLSLSDIAWLFTEDDSNDGIDIQLAEILSKACLQLRKQKIECLFAVGSPFLKLATAYRSYREALSVANRSTPDIGIPVEWYWSLKKSGERYEYRLETEEKLIHFIHSGDTEALHFLLEVVKQENFIERKLTSVMKRMLINELEATLVKAVEYEKILISEQLVTKLEETVDLDACFELLVEAFDENCRLYTVERHSSSYHLSLKIKEMIHLRYSDSELGLKMVSVETGITEAYLSRIFKEHIGENFASYVEKIRIEEACKMLSNPACSVVSVAVAVGYNSDHVFRRAFKRVNGMNPLEYRRGMGLK